MTAEATVTGTTRPTQLVHGSPVLRDSTASDDGTSRLAPIGPAPVRSCGHSCSQERHPKTHPRAGPPELRITGIGSSIPAATPAIRPW